MHKSRAWFIPAYITNYKEGHEPDLEDVTLFTLVDTDTASEYIPVFDNSQHCDQMIGEINAGKRDKSICIYAFPSLSDIEKRVRKDFGRPVQLIVHTSDGVQEVSQEEQPTDEDTYDPFGSNEENDQ